MLYATLLPKCVGRSVETTLSTSLMHLGGFHPPPLHVTLQLLLAVLLFRNRQPHMVSTAVFNVNQAKVWAATLVKTAPIIQITQGKNRPRLERVSVQARDACTAWNVCTWRLGALVGAPREGRVSRQLQFVAWHMPRLPQL